MMSQQRTAMRINHLWKIRNNTSQNHPQAVKEAKKYVYHNRDVPWSTFTLYGSLPPVVKLFH